MLGVIAAISMLGAALAALAQDDLKRVLAYSTVSQLAYMAGGLPSARRDGAIFHLLAHGAFKALLFLGAGCVIVAVGSNMLSDMGGLRHADAGDVLVDDGRLRGAGRHPAGERLLQQGRDPGAGLAAPRSARRGHPGLDRLAGPDLRRCVTAAVTAAYATRTWLVTFFGEQRGRR